MNPLLILTLAACVAADPLPPHAVVRLGDASFHLHGTADHTVISPDGRFVAIGERDHLRVTVWDTVSGRVSKEYPGHFPIAYSPDGRILAVSGADFRLGNIPRAILFLDTATGQEVGRLPEDRSEDRFAAFAGNGTFLLHNATQKVVQVWDVTTRRVVRTFPHPQFNTLKIDAISPDGKYFATIERDRGIAALHLSEIATGRELFVEKVRFDMSAVGFAPDGKSVVWLGTERIRHRIPDGTRIGEPVRVAPNTNLPGTPAYGNESVYLFRIEGDGLKAIDVETGKPAKFPLNLPLCVDNRSCPTDQFVRAAGSRLEVWDLKTGVARHPATGHTLPITGVAFDLNGRPVTCDVRSVRRWTPDGGESAVFTFPEIRILYASALTPDGRVYLHGVPGQKFQFWSAETGKPLGSIETKEFRGTHVTPTPDGKAVLALFDKGLSYWDYADPEPKWTIPRSKEGGTLTTPTISPDGRLLYTGTSDGTCREWNARTGEELRRLGWKPGRDGPGRTGGPVVPARVSDDSPGHQGYVIGLAVSLNGRRLISAGSDRTVRVWDLRAGKECAVLDESPREIQSRSLRSGVPLAVSPDGSLVAVASLDDRRRNGVNVWNLRTGRRLVELDGHDRPASALAFSPDGRRLLSGSDDATAIVWELPPQPKPTIGVLSTETQDALWNDLSGENATAAYRALGAWITYPDAATATLRRHQKKIPQFPAGHVDRLIADLDDPVFATRDKAMKELEDIGPLAGEKLRRALADSTSAELTRRIQTLLKNDNPGERVRHARAVEVLEAIGTPQAKELLADWAGGEPEAVLTKEAASALERLERRAGIEKRPAK